MALYWSELLYFKLYEYSNLNIKLCNIMKINSVFVIVWINLNVITLFKDSYISAFQNLISTIQL